MVDEIDEQWGNSLVCIVKFHSDDFRFAWEVRKTPIYCQQFFYIYRYTRVFTCCFSSRKLRGNPCGKKTASMSLRDLSSSVWRQFEFLSFASSKREWTLATSRGFRCPLISHFEFRPNDFFTPVYIGFFISEIGETGNDSIIHTFNLIRSSLSSHNTFIQFSSYNVAYSNRN